MLGGGRSFLSESNTLFFWIARNKPGNDGGFC